MGKDGRFNLGCLSCSNSKDGGRGGSRWLVDIRISASDDNVFSAGRGCPWYLDMGRVRLNFSITCEIRLDDFVSLTLVLFQ